MGSSRADLVLGRSRDSSGDGAAEVVGGGLGRLGVGVWDTLGTLVSSNYDLLEQGVGAFLVVTLLACFLHVAATGGVLKERCTMTAAPARTLHRSRSRR